MNFEPVARPESTFAKKYVEEKPIRTMHTPGMQAKIIENDSPDFDVSAFSPSGYKKATDTLNRLVQMSDNPQEEAEKLYRASYLASKTNYSPEYIYANTNKVLHEVAGYDMSLDVRKGWDYFLSTIKYTNEANGAYTKFEQRGDEIARADVSEEEREGLYDELRKEIIAFNNSQPDFEKVKGWIPDTFLDSLAQTTPYMGKALVGNVAGRILGVGISALVPAAAPAILTAQFISNWAGRLGSMFAVKPLLNASSYVDRLIMQNEDGEYMDPSLANWGSELSSWLEAAVESMAFDVFAPWVGKLFTKTGGSALVNGSISRVLRNSGIQYIKGVTAESAEEGLQAIVRDVTDNTLKTIDANANGRKWDRLKIGQVLENAGNEFLKSVPTMAFLGLLSGGIGTGIELSKVKTTQKYDADVHFSGEGSVVPAGNILSSNIQYDNKAVGQKISAARNGKQKMAPIDVYKVGDISGSPIYRAVGSEAELNALKERGVQSIRINEVDKNDYVAPITEENYQQFSDLVNQAASDAGALASVDQGSGSIIVSNNADLANLRLNKQIPITSLTSASDNYSFPNEFGMHSLDLGVNVGGEASVQAVTESTYAVRDLMYGRALEELITEIGDAPQLKAMLKEIYEHAHTSDDVFLAMQFAQEKKPEVIAALENVDQKLESASEVKRLASLKKKPDIKQFRKKAAARDVQSEIDKAEYEMSLEELAAAEQKKEAALSKQDEAIKKNKQEQAKNEWKKDPVKVDDKKFQEVTRRVSELDKRSGVETIVVDDGRMFPEVVRSAAEEEGQDPNTIPGVYYNGTVYINAAGVTNVDKTWAHEWIAHRGIRALLGNNADTELEKLFDILGEKEMRRKVPEAYWSHQVGNRNAYIADEYLAFVAQDLQRDGKIQQTVWEKIKTFVRRVLRALGLKMENKAADIRALLADAYSALNKNTLTNKQGVRFQLAPPDDVNKMETKDLPDDVIYHTSPKRITSIDKYGTFGDVLFFASKPYVMTAQDQYVTYAITTGNTINVSQLYDEKLSPIINDIVNYLDEKIDIPTAESLLDGSVGAYEVLSGEEAGDLGWYIQMKQGEAAKLLGYDAAIGEDEQGSVYIVPMLGRESELIEVIDKTTLLDDDIRFQVAPPTDYQAFKNWFKNSVVVDEYGNPKNVYHQTSYDAFKDLLTGSGIFRKDMQSAGEFDNETPIGFFFKSSDRDIGLQGKSQVQVFLSIQNPAVFGNREELSAYLFDNVPEWRDLKIEYDYMDKVNIRIFDDMMDEEDDTYAEWYKTKGENEEYTSDYEERSDVLLNEWKAKGISLSARMKTLVTDFFNNSEYDGIYLEEDAGGFGKRLTDAYIVFDPTQVKSVYNQGTWDPNNPDIRFSINDTLQKMFQEGYIIPEEVLENQTGEWVKIAKERNKLFIAYPDLINEAQNFDSVESFIPFVNAMTPYALTDDEIEIIYNTIPVKNPVDSKKDFREKIMTDEGLLEILGSFDVGMRVGNIGKGGYVNTKASKGSLSNEEKESVRNSILKNIETYYADYLIALGDEESIRQLEYESYLRSIGISVADDVNSLILSSEEDENIKKSIAPMIKDKSLRDQFMNGSLSILDIDERLSSNRKELNTLRKRLKSVLDDSKQYRQVYENIRRELLKYQAQKNARDKVSEQFRRQHKAAVKSAVERGLPVPDKNLELYRDEEWAQKEISKRGLFRMYGWVLDLAKKADGVKELRALVDNHLDADDDKPEMGEDFLEEAFRLGNAANSEQFYIGRFLDKVNSTEGLKGILQDIDLNRESFYGIGIPRVVWNAVQKREKLTPEEMDNLRAAIYKNTRRISRVYYYGMGEQDAISQFRADDVQNVIDDKNGMTVEDRVKVAAMAEDQTLKNKLLKGDYTYQDLKEYQDKYNNEIAGLMRENDTLERSVQNAEKEMEEKVQSLRSDISDTREARDKKISEIRKTYQDRIAKLRAEKNQKMETQRKELLQKQKDRDAVRKMRENMKYLYGRISRRVPPGSVDYFYGKKLEGLTRLFDGKILNKAGHEGRAENLINILGNFEEYDEAGFMKAISDLGNLALNEFSEKQLEAVYRLTEDLRSAGRQIKQAKDLSRKLNRLKVINNIRDEILDGEDAQLFEAIGSVETEAQQKSSTAFRAWAATLRPTRMIDKLGGKVMKEWFVDQVNKVTDEEIRNWHRRHEGGVKKMEELGITSASLARDLTYGGKTFSVDQIIHLYLAMMNDASRNAVLFGNNINNDIVNGLVAQLSEAEISWGDYMIQDFENEYNRLNDAFIRDKNVDMGKEEAYFPMKRRDLENNAIGIGELMGEQYAIRNAWKKGYAKKDFTIARVRPADEHQIPIQLGATSIWLSQIDAQEHYISSQELIKDLQYYQNDQSIKDALKQKYGTAATKWLLKYVNDFANPNIYKTYTEVDNISRKLRNNMAIAYLSFNALTVLKQAPSLGFYLRAAGPQHILGAAFQMITNPLKTIKEVEFMDPQMMVRSYNRIQEELSRMSEDTAAQRLLKKVGTMGMKPIMWMDKAITTIGWMATYNANIAKGKTESEAAREAQRTTLETQPAGRAKDLAQAYRSSEAANWLLMFSNQLNQIWNMYTYDLPNSIKEHEYRKLAGIVAGIALSGISIAMLSGWRLPEDPDDLPKEVVVELFKNFLSSIPIVGSNIKSGFDKEYFSIGMVTVPAAATGGKLIGDIKDGEVDKIGKDLYNLVMDLGITAGVPTTVIKRSVNVVQHQDLLELLGYGFVRDRRD